MTGRVRNRPDGTVEVRAEGRRPDLEKLVEVVSRGPVGARVHDVETRWTEGNPEHQGFQIEG